MRQRSLLGWANKTGRYQVVRLRWPRRYHHHVWARKIASKLFVSVRIKATGMEGFTGLDSLTHRLRLHRTRRFIDLMARFSSSRRANCRQYSKQKRPCSKVQSSKAMRIRVRPCRQLRWCRSNWKRVVCLCLLGIALKLAIISRPLAQGAARSRSHLTPMLRTIRMLSHRSKWINYTLSKVVVNSASSRTPRPASRSPSIANRTTYSMTGSTQRQDFSSLTPRYFVVSSLRRSSKTETKGTKNTEKSSTRLAIGSRTIFPKNRK